MIQGSNVDNHTACKEPPGRETQELIEKVLQRENVRRAYRRVVKNKGAPGIDGVTVEDLGTLCRERWEEIREELRNGTYKPQPIRKVEIPKPDGRGMRVLGIPTVMDRLIQQAVLQVMQPIFEPTFSDHSFGFRPGRSTHMAVQASCKHVNEGAGWVVDLDLEKFFDRVQHDVLMSRVARRVKDKQLLRLIRRFLQAGMMEGGVVSPRVEGTPQGSPLSPLLSNILLDELDKELEHRGHHFVRYADDCNVYVHSQKAGERVMGSLERFLWERLRLTINRDKSAVAKPEERTFLGYTVRCDSKGKRLLEVSAKSIERLKTKLKLEFRIGRGRRLTDTIASINKKTRGWVNYFRLNSSTPIFAKLDGWIRRHLRAIQWRQWKQSKTRRSKVIELDVPPKVAKMVCNRCGAWRSAQTTPMQMALSNAWFTTMGFQSLLDRFKRLTSIR